MNKQEVIESLEKKRERALDNLEYYRDKENEKYEKMNRARVDSYTIAIQAVEQIDEPQAEKVEVPDFVAEWYETNKSSLESNIAAAFRRIGSDEHYTKGPIYEWLNDSSNEPIQTLFKMKDGYTVKPKRWVVKKGKDCVLTSFTFFDEQSVNYNSNSYGKDYLIFTDKSKAEAVATLVDGTVEEG